MKFPVSPNPQLTGNPQDDIKNIVAYLNILSLNQKDEILTGTLILWSDIVIPAGAPSADAPYLRANNQAVSRTAFADLFARIGIRFGAGDGTTTFNVPPAPSVVANCIWLIHI